MNISLTLLGDQEKETIKQHLVQNINQLDNIINTFSNNIDKLMTLLPNPDNNKLLDLNLVKLPVTKGIKQVLGLEENIDNPTQSA